MADRSPGTRWRPIAWAGSLYLVWVLATWLLEGRIRTFLRPEAVGARLAYALVANILVGVLLAAWTIRHLVQATNVVASRTGFGSPRRTLVALPAGVLLGGAIFLLLGAPTGDAVVLLNGFAQVLTVSIAEVVVCWSLLAIAAESGLGARPRRIAVGAALVVAAVAFGVYHVAHSPPFNAPARIAQLTLVGLGTGVFFATSRDVYGTIAFHNSFAAYGVLESLATSGRLGAFETLQPALLVTALVSVAALVIAHRWIIPSDAEPASSGRSPIRATLVDQGS